MLVGADDKQGALTLVTISCLQNDMNDVLRPEKCHLGKILAQKEVNLHVTAMAQKLKGFTLCKCKLSLFICRKDEFAILHKKGWELANYIIQIDLTLTCWEQTIINFQLTKQTPLPFIKSAIKRINAQYIVFIFVNTGLQQSPALSVNTGKT